MKGRKNQVKIAKILFKKSLTGNYVDTKKVQLVLKKIVAQKPVQLINILKIYKKIIENALGKEQIVIESAQKLKSSQKFEKEILSKTGAKRIIYKTDPNIILGSKITHGDWVWDETLSAKLKQLTINN